MIIGQPEGLPGYHRMSEPGGKLDFILEQTCRLDRTRPVLVGVSGGADSLYLAAEMQDRGWSLAIAHFDHALREGSAGEAKAVEEFAGRLQVPFVHARESVQAYAAQAGLSLEEAARKLRYHFLFAQAQYLGVQAVAVAHTANDQVETVLMHFLRGSGLSGLAGMPYRSLPNPWSETIPLVRPLLGIWREQIDAENARRGRVPLEDPSNRDTRYYRNRLRHELLPYLESYNPAIHTVLLRTAEVLKEDEAVLESLTRAAWENLGFEQGAGWVSFSTAVLLDQPTAVQRRLLRLAISRLRPGLRDIDLQTVERGLDFLRRGTGRRVELSAGLSLLREQDLVYLAAWEADLPHAGWPQLAGEQEAGALALNIPGEIELPSGWQLSARRLAPSSESYGDPYEAWIAEESVRLPLRVRARLPGDRIRLLGMETGSQKISDLMINARLPERARARWPLVLSGEEIIWVPGLRAAHPFRLQPDTKGAIHLKLGRKDL